MITIDSVKLQIDVTCNGCEKKVRKMFFLNNTDSDPTDSPLRCGDCMCEYLEGEQIIIGES